MDNDYKLKALSAAMCTEFKGFFDIGKGANVAAWSSVFIENGAN